MVLRSFPCFKTNSIRPPLKWTGTSFSPMLFFVAQEINFVFVERGMRIFRLILISVSHSVVPLIHGRELFLFPLAKVKRLEQRVFQRVENPLEKLHAASGRNSEIRFRVGNSGNEGLLTRMLSRCKTRCRLTCNRKKGE